MAALSAADLRREARNRLTACGLRGFVRILRPGGELLVSDALRGLDEAHCRTALRTLEDAGFVCRRESDLLFLSPSEAALRALAGEAQMQSPALQEIDWTGEGAEAQSLALRLLQKPPQTEWSREGYRLLLEILRLPEGIPDGQSLQGIRAQLALMLRGRDSSAMHEAGALLAARFGRSGCL